MKEHKDDGLLTVDSTTSDEIVTERGKIEGILGERDGGDMVVDAVSADVAVDEDGGTKVEDVEISVETLGEVEVVVSEEVVKEVVVSGSGCDERKSANGPGVEDSDEGKTGGGEIEVIESVQEVAEKSQKGTESTEGDLVMEEGIVVKDKAEDGVRNQSSTEEVVNVGTCEDNVHVSAENTGSEAGVDQTKKESFQSTIEATTRDSKMVVELDRGVAEETVERVTESVQEAADVDCVMGEETGKDEILDSTKILDSVTKVDEVVTKEGLSGKDENQDGVSADQSEGAAVHENAEKLDQNAEVDQMNTEESSQSTIEVRTHDASISEKETDSKMDYEPEIIKGEIDVLDKGDETELGFTKETLEQPVDSVQEVADRDHDSSKSHHSSVMASLGLEEDDVVVVDDGLEGKNEAQDLVSVEPSLVNPDNQSILTEVVNVGAGEVDQKAEVDSTNKDESSFATIQPEEVAACGKVDEVMIAQKEPNSDVQASTDVEVLVENQSINVNVVTDSDKPDVVAYTEPVSNIDKMTPGIANKVVETDTGVQNVKAEPATIDHDSSDFQVDQGLNANQSNQGNEITASQIRVPDSTAEVPTTGMDIDEVLGWKDEIPSVQEDEQKVDPTNLSNVEVQETEALEHTLESKQWNKTSVSLQQSRYFRAPENEGEFSVSDLVWGKVRSHPWWPGQIFDPSDASEKAMKYHKKDCLLVAYFGDRTFRWNDSTVLKPLRENFSQIVEHMNSEAFDNAVHCALQEVSRRVELGLTCSCIPHDIYENIKYQIVDNSGIKQESSKRHGADESASVNSFEPDMLVDYMRLLAKFPYDAGDKMELTMAKAQLSSYGRFKGHRQLAEFQLSGDLLEAELVIKDEPYSEDGSKKRKALDSISDGSEKRPALQTETVTAKPPFKVGGCIQKVASQLTGPPEQVTANTVSVQSPGPTQLGNQAGMLSQLHMAAQDPMKGSRLNSSNDAKKRKTSNENETEEFEFDDVNDSYWTDRIIQNYPEENPLQENQNGGGGHQIVAYEQEKPVKPARRSNKKRFFSSNHEIEAKEQSELIERRQKNLATEVLMKFTEGIYFPSEIHLNKMFRRFGPLMESETEVDRQSGRARVVFKKCSDAEVAHSSAGTFNIFGSINVNYELNYTPLISYKPLPLPSAQDPDMHASSFQPASDVGNKIYNEMSS
ncbi:hypothetical protein L1987_62212 [Smallanthus sonchifolius]|uniref:Uncharacterized protein n=1 Tax=Smallanthus sonchifolius TaxID=185202 RepID=A0ACB9C9R9_9ASTR|nr:hypothetical protein L1987_62212 [Smallanthus sonchifolius]